MQHDDDNSVEQDEDHYKNNEINENKSITMKLKVNINDLLFLDDKIVQNKKKINDKDYEIEVTVPYNFIFKLLQYIKKN